MVLAQNPPLRPRDLPGCDFAILAAQDQELNSLLKIVRHIAKGQIDNDIVYFVELPQTNATESNPIRGYISRVNGVGRVDAALAASRLLNGIQPGALYLIGIAGAFVEGGARLGDIVVADKIIDYEIRRITDTGEEFRLKTFETNTELLQAARHAAACQEFHGGHRPTVHFGPMLSGDKIVASTRVASQLGLLHEGLLGVEMEGAGVAAAIARSIEPVRFLMIRGIVDLANDRKREDSEAWLATVCGVLAEFTVQTAITACTETKSRYSASV
jgi:nucleoside phosphorylase